MSRYQGVERQQDAGQYELIDRTERQHREVMDITSFAVSPDLGRELDANILVKWTNQTYHDGNLRAMFTPEWDTVAGISRTNAWRHRNQYYNGLIVQTSLDAEHLDTDSATTVTRVSQPTGIDTRPDGLTAFACADKILLSPDGNPRTIASSLGHLTFARLHSVAFSPDGERLLTASSSLDLIHELDLEGTIRWTFDAWQDTSFNTNKLGQTFFRRDSKAPGAESLRNPDPQNLKDDPELRNKSCILDDPSQYNRLGLPTNLTPVFINSAAYGAGGTILATSFHRGEAWIIDPDNRRITVAAKDMGNPHGMHLHQGTDGYLVTDTTHERVHFLDAKLGTETTVDLSGLGERKSGLEKAKWLQYTTQLDTDLIVP
jgi:hypothetical protein